MSDDEFKRNISVNNGWNDYKRKQESLHVTTSHDDGSKFKWEELKERIEDKIGELGINGEFTVDIKDLSSENGAKVSAFLDRLEEVENEIEDLNEKIGRDVRQRDWLKDTEKISICDEIKKILLSDIFNHMGFSTEGENFNTGDTFITVDKMKCSSSAGFMIYIWVVLGNEGSYKSASRYIDNATYKYKLERIRVYTYVYKNKNIVESIDMEHGGWSGKSIRDIIMHSGYCCKISAKELKDIKKSLYESDYPKFFSLINAKCNDYFKTLYGRRLDS